MTKIILIIALIILAIWLLRKMFPVGKKHLYGRAKGPEELSSHNHAYEAVSIHSYKDRCTAAEQVAGQRFLSSEAPPLPLKSCTSEKCHCVYIHHSDRRAGTDRRVIHESEEAFLSSPGYHNRRICRGRRASDLALA
jgi:hypothetical protein